LNRAFFDLSRRAKLRVRGSDRERFLNGQLTNDVRKATGARAIEACALNAKGRLNAHLFLRMERDSFLLDAAPELRESLPARLERYIIADDVQIEEVTSQLSLFHIVHQDLPVFPNEFDSVSANRFRGTGRDVWVESTRHDELFRRLSEQFTFCDAECAEVFRIENGIPRWRRELTEEIIPVEANLETQAIDYEKGCYIGQEVISRMKMSAQTNKRLRGLVSLRNAPLVAGMKLFAAGGEKKEAGWITSAANSRRLGKQIGLGYVKRGLNLPGTRLEALDPERASGSGSEPVEVVDLPFRGRQ
jgi:folate-binding protein YgfZ